VQQSDRPEKEIEGSAPTVRRYIAKAFRKTPSNRKLRDKRKLKMIAKAKEERVRLNSFYNGVAVTFQCKYAHQAWRKPKY